MDIMRKTAIVVPCYNEALRIQKNEFLSACDLLQNVSFVFVNDCSEDNTALILQELKSIKPKQIFIINLSKNSGKAEAVRQGILYAFNGNFGCIGFWDADLSTPLSDIKIFIDKLNESPDIDIVMGARVQLLGRSISRRVLRHYLGRIFATFASIILCLPVYDTQCGAKLFRNSHLLHQIFREPFKTRWVFDVEILARYISKCEDNRRKILSGKIIEYPLESWTDIPGSKLKLKDFIGSGFELVLIWFSYRKDLGPMGENSTDL